MSENLKNQKQSAKSTLKSVDNQNNNVSQYSLGNITFQTFEDIVSPSLIIEEETPTESTLFNIAIITEPGKIDDPDNPGTWIDQPVTGTDDELATYFVKVDHIEALQYIRGRDYIIEEMKKTNVSVLLCTRPYTDELVAIADTMVRTILLDVDSYKIAENIVSSKSALCSMISYASYNSNKQEAGAYAHRDNRSVMIIENFGSFDNGTGKFIGDKAKLFRTYFMWLAPKSIHFINRRNINEPTWLGELNETATEEQKTLGLSLWRRNIDYAWLDNMMIGGSDAIQFYIKLHVEYVSKIESAKLYDEDLTQDNITKTKGDILDALSNLAINRVIDIDVPLINETGGRAYVVFTKPFSQYSQTEREARKVTYLITFYKFGRVNRIPLFIALKK